MMVNYSVDSGSGNEVESRPLLKDYDISNGLPEEQLNRVTEADPVLSHKDNDPAATGLFSFQS